MKKLIAILLSVTMLFSVAATADFSAYALSSGKCGANVNYTFYSDSGVLYINGSGPMYNYSLSPGQWSPFCRESGIKLVRIDSGITTIGDYMFYDCDNLLSVSCPDTVKTIGNYAFYDCNGLPAINLSNVTSIGENAFSGSHISKIILGDTLTYIGKEAFSFSRLYEIIILKNVSTIGERAFYGCEYLQRIDVDAGNQYYSSVDGVLFNKKGTKLILFPRCKSVSNSEYTVPAGVNQIGEYAFSGNLMHLHFIRLPNSVTRIDDYAFSESLIKEITLSAGLTTIGSWAFYQCKISEITIPNSVTSIGEYAFYECNSLSKVNISSVYDWCKISFDGFQANPLYYAKALCLNGQPVEHLVIPEGVSNIGRDAFCNAVGIKSVTLPRSVVNIGGSVFYNCTEIKSVFYAGSGAEWKNITVSDGNVPLTQAAIHYNSTGEHAWDAGVIQTAPTCTAGGSKRCTCTVCGESKTESIPALGHDFGNNAAYCRHGCGTINPSLVLDKSGVVDAGSDVVLDEATSAAAAKALGIKVKTVKLISVKSPKKKTITIGWQKAKKVSGYVVQVSTSKKFKKGTRTYIAKASSKNAKIAKKIKGKKKYYIRIRAFKTVTYNGEKVTVYGKWSKAKAVKTKG